MFKVPYHEKHACSGLYIYKLVLPKPANSQNEENKYFLHDLYSPPPTSKTALLQAVPIQLLSLRNKRSHLHRPTLQIALLLVVKINISAYILSKLQNNRGDSGCI